MMISVAMTTYNGEKFILKQLQSILNQSVSVNEVIICDDCSTDATVDIIRQIKDNRIKLIVNEKNEGYIKNFYKAISLTKGDFIFLADQDDIWVEDKVEKMVELIKKEQCGALCTNFILIDQNDEIIGDQSVYQINSFIKKAKNKLQDISFFRLIFGNIVQGCTYCFTKEIKNLYLTISNNTVIHDYQIMLVAAACSKVVFLNEPLIYYRLHGNNSIGFQKKQRKLSLERKVPSAKPFMVQFLEDLNKVVPVKKIFVYKLLYYLRIPSLRESFIKLIFGG